MTFFNVGMYQMSDGIDSLVLRLSRIGLEEEANKIVTLSEIIEYQQQIIILLDIIKCFCMLVPILFFFLLYYNTFGGYMRSIYSQLKKIKTFVTKKLNLKKR